MNAKDFIKKYGLSSFKVAMICPKFGRYNYAILYSDEVDFSNKFIEKHADYMFKTSDIKRLVESHELVQKLGGLIKAKEIEQQYWNSGVGSAMSVAMELKQAIQLVEEVNNA